MLPFDDSPSELELHELDLAALDLFFAIFGYSVLAGFIAGAVLIYRSNVQFGNPGLAKNIWGLISAAMSFFAVFMPFTVFWVFGNTLGRSWPGISIMLGLLGIEWVGALRLIALWSARSQQIT